MALNFRQPSNTIVTQDKYSRLHIDSRTTSIFKKTFKGLFIIEGVVGV